MSAPLLVFRHRGRLFAIASTAVSEVVALGRLTRVPSPPPFIRGVVNHHGSVLPVVDSDALLGTSSGAPAATASTALILSERDTRLVFPVDATLGLESPEAATASGDASLERVVAIGGRAVDVVRVAELLARIGKSGEGVSPAARTAVLH